MLTPRTLRTVVTASLAGLLALLGVGALPASAGAVARDGGDGARVVAEQQVAPRQLDLTVDSPALGGTAKVRLLTPDGWTLGPTGTGRRCGCCTAAAATTPAGRR